MSATNRLERVRVALGAAFEPTHLAVEDESHMHSGVADQPTHLRIVLVSARFSGRTPVQRHRAVHAALADELRGGLHALALHCFSPVEWDARAGSSTPSPPCRGGSKSG